MEIIDRIPVVLEPGETSRRLRFKPARAGFPNLDELIDLARTLIQPRAAVMVAYTGLKGEDSVEIGGSLFRSRVLRKNLEKTRKVFPYIMTVGPELEKAAGAGGDLLRQYYLEEIANIALGEAAGWLADRLSLRHGLPGLANMSPGSLEDWPITEQTPLFGLFAGAERGIGVRLTESLLMLPRKSISGILFASEEGFSSCQLCERDDCQGRKAPYDRALAAKYDLESRG